MCIATTVGPNGPNRFEDVKAVQVLLNMNRVRAGIASELVADGVWGTHTQEIITAFQSRVMGIPNPNGQIEPSGSTLNQLQTSMPPELSEVKLQGTMPRARPEDIVKFSAQMASTLSAYAINTPL